MIPHSYRPIPAAPVEVPLGYQEAVGRFARFLGVKHFSPNTRRLYVAALRRWLEAGGAPGHVDGDRLARYLAHRRQTCGAASINMDLKALRSFYRLQDSWEALAPGDLAKIPAGRRVPARLVRFLDEAQVGEALGALPLETYAGLRDYCLIRVIFEAGLRASELAGLELGDLLSDGTLFVRGKGGRDRYVPISSELQGVLAGYVHARGLLRPGKKNRLWLAHDGHPLANGRSVWEIVARRLGEALGTRCGLQRLRATGKPWQGHYPHLLRASFATALLRRGCPITAIAQLMGHADVATTAHYLGVDLEQLRAAVRLHPRAIRAVDDVLAT